MQCRIKDISHLLLDINDTLYEQPIINYTKLVALDILNMFPNKDNQREIQAVRDILNTHAIKEHLQIA